MTAVYFPWAAELLLECLGAYLNFRRSKLLAAILSICAVTDILNFFIFTFARPAYVWACWAQIALKGLLLIWLACSICGMFVAEKRRDVTTFSAAVVSIGAAALITAVSFTGESLKHQILDAEIAANFILLGMVALGWIGRQGKLSHEWKWIVAGFMLMVGSDLLFTALWMFWDGARHWYPLGAISAQLVWVIGPLKSVKLPELRKSLEHKFPEVERVRVC